MVHSYPGEVAARLVLGPKDYTVAASGKLPYPRGALRPVTYGLGEHSLSYSCEKQAVIWVAAHIVAPSRPVLYIGQNNRFIFFAENIYDI